MNKSVDIATAFRIATSDLELKFTSFSQPYTLDAGKAECLACTAPGFSEAHSTATSSGNAPAVERENDHEPGVSKSAKKKAKAAASRQVLNDKLKAAQAAAANHAPRPAHRPGTGHLTSTEAPGAGPGQRRR